MFLYKAEEAAAVLHFVKCSQRKDVEEEQIKSCINNNKLSNCIVLQNIFCFLFLGREEAEEEDAVGLSLRQPEEPQLVGLQILLL